MTTKDTVELHHLLEGSEDAPVLVLSNSLGTTLAMWDEQAPALSEHFRLLRYDHRGHGGSPVPPGAYTIEDLGRDVIALLDRLGVERFSFCGLSLGGMVGMWLASEAPERIDRLVLCCTSARFDPDAYESRARAVRQHGVTKVAEAVLERWFTPAFRESRPEVAEWAMDMLRDTPPEGYAGCCEAIAAAELPRRLGVIRAPTLVIAGADDPAAPPDRLEFIRDSIPGAQLVVIPQAAHLANVEQPEAVTRAVLDHLEGGRVADGAVNDPVRDRGMRIRREVLGDDHVDAALKRKTDFTADFQDLITRYAWGEIWARPGLDRRMRSAITLTALVALGRLEELEMHVRAALRNGLGVDEIREVLLQSAIYCGVPAANSAFAVAQRVLSEGDESAGGDRANQDGGLQLPRG
jgi:3-oxoadipate enol-lactonase/4-carboxymuconolactone decarboxylase